MIRRANLHEEADAAAVLALTQSYATDPQGAGAALPPDVASRLIPALRSHPSCFVFLAYEEGNPVGMANCFLTFSSFRAAPILNIHDLVVLPAHRGQGLSTALLGFVETEARKLGCAYVSLEVSVANVHAQKVYAKRGFAGTELGDDATLFCRKVL